MQALIYVIDSSDDGRIEEAKNELYRLLSDSQMCDVPVLVLANKQDKQNALKAQEIVERLDMMKLRDRGWYVQPTCAINGDGLYEGLTWLTTMVR